MQGILLKRMVRKCTVPEHTVHGAQKPGAETWRFQQNTNLLSAVCFRPGLFLGICTSLSHRPGMLSNLNASINDLTEAFER